MSERVWRPGSVRAPDGVSAVVDQHGRVWRRDGEFWDCPEEGFGTHWRLFVAAYGPVREVTEGDPTG